MVMKKMFLMLVVVLFGASIALSQEEEEANPIGLDITASMATENNFYGYDLNDGDGIWKLGATYQIPKLPIIGKGLSVGVESFSPISDGSEKQTRVDYSVAYRFSLLEDTSLQMDTSVGYTYLDFVKASRDEDLHRFNAIVSLPKVFTVLGNPLVPSVEAVRLWDVSTKNIIHFLPVMNSTDDGWIFILGANYYAPIAGQVVDFSAKATYNDGIGASDSSISHITLGASTDFEITDNVKLVPFVRYQISQEDTVSNEDSVYGGAAVKISF